jgi:hypothetical protein
MALDVTVLTDDKLNEILTDFADSGLEIGLRMSKDGFWLRWGDYDQAQISGEQTDKVLIAMRCMRVC